MIYSNVVPASFISRPNRFIAYVELEGRIVRVHVKNTGRGHEILVPGAEVYLCPGTNPGRSTPYDLIAVRKGDFVINIDSQAPNVVAKESIGKILGRCDLVKPECTCGESRFDFYAESGDQRIFMEVKGVTLENDGVVMFPDAPTERGLKHVRELTRLVKEGYRCVICFIIQMDEALYMTPNYDTHREFGEALQKAQESGVEVVAYTCRTTPGSLELKDRVEVVFTHRGS